jgi:predicted PhzF superfamily epimerase YddE/YHI9
MAMRIPYFQVNAFTSQTFGGNPAGVCVLEDWLPDAMLQRIATENNLSETAFFVKADGHFQLRWFTPAIEVDLCGHATLASAFVLFSELEHQGDTVQFESRSGSLAAARREDIIELDFPSRPPVPCGASEELLRGLGRKPREVLHSRDYVAVFESEAEVASLRPDMAVLGQVDCLGIIATARGQDTDFVSRFFAPRAGVPEDPVTGSAHCSLIPFWAERLGKTELFARQISQRGGELFCRNAGERVGIGGRAVIYCRGELEVS